MRLLGSPIKQLFFVSLSLGVVAFVVFASGCAGGNQCAAPSQNTVPTISSPSPSLAMVGAASHALAINGPNFPASSTVTYKGVAHTAVVVSASELTIALSAADQATAGNSPVVVPNPLPGGGSSKSVNVTVNNPVPAISSLSSAWVRHPLHPVKRRSRAPAITSLSPPWALAGSQSQTLTINGTGFVQGSSVTYNRVAHTTTFVTSGQLTITLSAADQATVGNFPVVVTNPPPVWGSSNSVNFFVVAVKNPIPAISSLSPTWVLAGSQSQTLTINGTGFVQTSSVTYNGVAHTTTFVSASQLIISLSAGDLATAGNFPVVVTNPPPVGGSSNSVNFTVNNPVPTITSLSPASVLAGSQSQTLTINGTGFVETSTATYNGVAHTVTFVSEGQLTMTLSAADQATGGNFPVVVSNPSPGGGASNAVNFSVLQLMITPATVNVLPGASQMFSATIAGQSNPPVVWSVEEGTDGGTITQSGNYTASNTPGIYHIVATSQTNPSLSATATVTVAPATTGLGFTAPAWQAIGPRAIPNAHACDSAAEAALLAAGKIQAFAVNPSNLSVMYAAGGLGPGNSGPYSDAGVFASTNGGAQWTAEDNGLTDRFVDALWLDQANPSLLLAGTWSAGIFRSTDGANSWTRVYSGSTTSIVQVGGVLYAANAAGVLTSSDLGATWQILEPTTSPVRALAASSGVIYAGLDNGSVITQQGGGSPWTTVINAAPNTTVWDITIDPTSPLHGIVVLVAAGVRENLVTSNGGGTWSTWSAPPIGGLCGSGGPGQVVAFDSVNPSLIYSGSGGAVYVSTDGGASWSAKHMLEDLRLLQPLPGQSGAIVVGGDQGIYMSSDAGTTWTSLNGDLSTNLLNDIAVNGTEISTTVQDFSPVQSFDGGSTWLQLSNPNPSARPAGENGAVLIDPKAPQYQYFWTTAGFWYSSDGGNNFTNDNANISYTEFTFNGTTDLVAIDPSNSQHVYLVGSSGIFQSTDFGVHWQPTGWPTPSPSFVVVDPNNANTIFVGSAPPAPQPNAVHFTHDGGATWQSASLPAGAFWPVSLAVDPSNSSVVVLAMSGTPNQPGGGVLISTNGGASFSSDNVGLTTYRNASQLQHYCWSVRFAPAAFPDVVAVATSDGLFISKAGGPWTDISGNAIPQWFDAIAWDSGFLYVSTYGQGVLRAPVTQIIK